MSKPEMMLWLDGARGQYIPRDFAQSFANRSKNVVGIGEVTWSILESGPDHEYYWPAWFEVLDHAFVIDNDGIRYSVYQDGDCWLVPVGMEWNEKLENFVWREGD